MERLGITIVQLYRLKDALDLKKQMIEIENDLKYGRVLDIDVIDLILI